MPNTARAAIASRAVSLLHEENPMSKTIAPITFQAAKPRNPFVVASRGRRAGSHRSSVGALRQRAQRSLLHELDRLRPQHHP
jgi:hypothetical protein